MMDFEYDAFISYSHSQKKWVNEVLLAAFEAGGVKTCIDHRNFDEGRSVPDNFGTAIKTSRRSVLVLTPEWVASGYTTSEGQMVWGTDPAGWHGRMVPIVRMACKLPMWISVRSWRDFTQDDAVIAGLPRLIHLLKSPLSPVVRTDDVIARLGRLTTGPLRTLALRYLVGLEEVADRTLRVGTLKEVHDELDNLQRHCLHPIANRLADCGAESLDQPTMENFHEYAATLARGILKLDRLQKMPVFASTGLEFIKKLQSAHDSLTECLATRKVKPARDATGVLARVMAVHPAKIDARLSEAASQAQLNRVIDALVRMIEEAHDMEPEAVADIEIALHELEKLDDNVQELVHTHSLWQELDIDFRLVESAITPNDITALANDWPDLKERATVLSTVVPMIVRSADSYGPAVDTALAGSDARLTISNFRIYKSHAGTRFHALDQVLKDQCAELVKAGDSVARLVKRLQDE
jgi:hypothetical protein